MQTSIGGIAPDRRLEGLMGCRRFLETVGVIDGEESRRLIKGGDLP
jgi:hypothetical protein